MTIPRRFVVEPDVVGIYHCISRCVRRAFLCGHGFDHRRDWIKSRLQDLAATFSVEVCGYAVMSNHFHVVLRIDPGRADRWPEKEVARRWLRLFPPRADPARPWDTVLEEAVRHLSSDLARIALLRKRLCDLSWFMRCLKEPIARRSNREDDCTGRFWEGRFKCHRLLDDAAVLACLVYVDLNVIRAGLATTPERSNHTSAYDRIHVRRHLRVTAGRPEARRRSAEWRRLLPTLNEGRKPRHDEDGIWLARIARRTGDRDGDRLDGLLPLSLEEYLDTVDASGRMVREGSGGAIPKSLRPILERLDLDELAWHRVMGRVGRMIGTAIGKAESLAAEAMRRHRRWVVSAMVI